ncbi:MAG: NeuD/PglB/VioB family sugar acetyltransferase [Gemmatimonadales bacterium]|jgi:UDP-perosamine 4-acetyltransferase
MSQLGPVVIYGAGGHGKVVLDALERAGRHIAGFVDDDPGRSGGEHCGHSVVEAPGEWGPGRRPEFVVAIGDAGDRQRACGRVEQLGYDLVTVVHPAAAVAADVRVGPGSMILAGAAINPGVRVGRGVIINTGAVVDHDCAIADFAHIAPGACLAGNVSVGERSLIGIGATVMPGITIAADALVAAGAVVVADVGEGVTVAGVPAKPLGRSDVAEAGGRG